MIGQEKTLTEKNNLISGFKLGPHLSRNMPNPHLVLGAKPKKSMALGNNPS